MTDVLPRDTLVDLDKPAAAVETPFGRFIAEFLESRVAAAALVVLVLLICMAVAAPWITPQNPYHLGSLDIFDSRKPPGAVATAGFTMFLGSDGLGRDLYSAIVAGTVVFALLVQLFINVGMTIGIAPVTGIPLPLVSYGGSSLLTTLILIGLLEAIHVRGRLAGAR